jgi:hypothetical protein
MVVKIASSSKEEDECKQKDRVSSVSPFGLVFSRKFGFGDFQPMYYQQRCSKNPYFFVQRMFEKFRYTKVDIRPLKVALSLSLHNFMTFVAVNDNRKGANKKIERWGHWNWKIVRNARRLAWWKLLPTSVPRQQEKQLGAQQ